MSRRRRGAAAADELLGAGNLEAAHGAEPGEQPPRHKRSRQGLEGALEPAATQHEAEESTAAQQPHPCRRSRRAAAGVPAPRTPCYSLVDPGSRVHIATSGYSYEHWHCEGSFYAGVPKRAEFETYSAEFNSVELNGTFYGWFSEDTFVRWREAAAAARPTFQYIVKASMFYTHKKRLNVDDVFRASWGRFWARCELLRPHLGPVLFQFPENFYRKARSGADNLERLRALGSVLPRHDRFVFEFRDSSWHVPEVYEVLRQHDWCLAIADVAKSGKGNASWCGTLTRGPNPRPEDYPLDVCSWGAYVRFHGASGKYEGAYGAKRMAEWAGHVARWLATGRSVYLAFNNTDDGLPPSAVADARDLAGALRARGCFP